MPRGAVMLETTLTAEDNLRQALRDSMDMNGDPRKKPTERELMNTQHQHQGGEYQQINLLSGGALGTFARFAGAALNNLTQLASTGISLVSAVTGISTQNAGLGAAHNNIQPSAVVLKCIKY